MSVEAGDIAGGEGASQYHSKRQRVDPQADPLERPNARSDVRWSCRASVKQQGTGKNIKSWINFNSPRFTGLTKEAVAEKREEWICSFLNVTPRTNKPGRFDPDMERSCTGGKRAAAPTTFSGMAEPRRGPSRMHARAGPGRGHIAEPAGPSILEEPVRINELKLKANWFEQLTARKVRAHSTTYRMHTPPRTHHSQTYHACASCTHLPYACIAHLHGWHATHILRAQAHVPILNALFSGMADCKNRAAGKGPL